MGQDERPSVETQTHNISGRPKEDRGGAAGTVGEVEGGEEEGGVGRRSLLRVHAMKITLEDALSLLDKYAEEQTLVLAAFVTPSVSVARMTGTIRLSSVAGTPLLLIGNEDRESDHIKFRLSDCVFEYGDFRDDEDSEHEWEGFLVVASKKGDTLSLFEPKS